MLNGPCWNFRYLSWQDPVQCSKWLSLLYIDLHFCSSDRVNRADLLRGSAPLSIIRVKRSLGIPTPSCRPHSLCFKTTLHHLKSCMVWLTLHIRPLLTGWFTRLWFLDWGLWWLTVLMRGWALQCAGPDSFASLLCRQMSTTLHKIPVLLIRKRKSASIKKVLYTVS